MNAVLNIGLLLLTLTDVSATCVVVKFRVQVSCVTSVDGTFIKLPSSDTCDTINWRDATHFYSEDDYRTGCRNISHCQQQQSYSGLRSPRWPYSTYLQNKYVIYSLISHYLHALLLKISCMCRFNFTWSFIYHRFYFFDCSILATHSLFKCHLWAGPHFLAISGTCMGIKGSELNLPCSLLFQFTVRYH